MISLRRLPTVFAALVWMATALAASAQPSLTLTLTHELRGTAYSISHDGERIAVLGDGLCIHSLSADVPPRCVSFEQPPTAVAWSVGDARIAVTVPRSPPGDSRIASGIEAVFVVDAEGAPAVPRAALYQSSAGGPGVTYAEVERWIDERLLVIEDRRGTLSVVDADSGTTVTSCNFIYRDGESSFVPSRNAWLGMGQSGRLNEARLEQSGGKPLLTCSVHEIPTPQTWWKFEDAFGDGRLLFSEQSQDKDAFQRLGADLVVTDADFALLDRWAIGSPASIAADGRLIASVRVTQEGGAHLLVTRSGRQTILDLPIAGYDAFGLGGDWSYERLAPSWSSSGRYVLLATTLFNNPNRLPSSGFVLVSFERGAATPVPDGGGRLLRGEWLRGDRLVVVRTRADFTSPDDILVYRVAE